MGMMIFRPGQRLVIPGAQVFAPRVTSSAATWWDNNGAISGCVAAYAAKGAADLAASYINLANPGTNNAAPGVAPTFNTATGWTFNGTTQYLTTGITADLTWTMLVEFSDAPDGNQIMAGYYSGGTLNFGLRPNLGGTGRSYFNGATRSVKNGASGGIMAIAGKNAYFNGNPDGTLAAGGTANGGSIHIGKSNTISIYYGGKIQRVGIWNRTLSAAEMQTIIDSIWSGSLDYTVVCEGDSMTAGVGATAGNDYPAQLDALLGAGYNVTNVGFSGHTLNNMTSDAATTDSLRVAVYRRNIICAWGGTNDIYFGQDAASTYAEYVTYCNARRANGWKVVAFTMLPRSSGGTPGDFETSRQTFNTSVRADWTTFADALADVAANTTIGDAGDETNTTYYGDLLHLTDAGYAIVANAVKTAVLSITT